MPNVREILNELKWTKDITKVKIWYIHRGAVHNLRNISGNEITHIGRWFFETSTATIPYHRITKISYGEDIVFNRWNLHPKDKQL